MAGTDWLLWTRCSVETVISIVLKTSGAETRRYSSILVNTSVCCSQSTVIFESYIVQCDRNEIREVICVDHWWSGVHTCLMYCNLRPSWERWTQVGVVIRLVMGWVVPVYPDISDHNLTPTIVCHQRNSGQFRLWWELVKQGYKGGSI